MATTKKLRYAIDEDQHPATWETSVDTEYEEAPPGDFPEVVDADYELAADPDYDDTGQVAYDDIADPDYGDEVAGLMPVTAEKAAEAPAPVTQRPQAGGFTYVLGRAVLPMTQEQSYPIVWRGYLKERHPDTGLLHRVPVYRLADGFWDCYREDELRVV
ncbi:hypothetical protein HHL22_22260 [Hymenobacter sp. RP-2-7]|uniref:Uncharacterized protein n=1 Tax=Hymenobacter polaris TaxID=2682546 RepID=A0A7Y0FPE4_9BACT|nr:hypothetical protein [Hymenobacter polaris]NML67933.1 hypothetical protein [Hymenobacter polaris]